MMAREVPKLCPPFVTIFARSYEERKVVTLILVNTSVMYPLMVIWQCVVSLTTFFYGQDGWVFALLHLYFTQPYKTSSSNVSMMVFIIEGVGGNPKSGTL